MNKLLIAVLLIIVSMSFLSPLISPYNPEEISLDDIRQPPSLRHPFGTDIKGRDILSRILFGGRVSISVAVVAAFLSVSIGLLAGLVSGYAGGKADAVIMLIVDFLLAFPSLLLAIGISVVLPPGVYTVIIAISAVGWASFARLIRGHVLSIREMPFIEAARAVGCSNARIVFVHILPQCISLIVVLFGLKLGGYILIEASLSFLGLGIQPPAPSWGSMISSSRFFVKSAPWMVIFPGLAILLSSLCFNMAGDVLRDKYAPRAAGRTVRTPRVP